MILLSVILPVCFVTLIHGQKLHEHMTKEEIQLTFNCKHDAIDEIEYEVIPIFHKGNHGNAEGNVRRLQSKIEIHAFNEKYNLYLEKNDNVLLGNNTPVFIAQTKSLNSRAIENSSDTLHIVYSRIEYPLPDSFQLFHDTKNNAALSLHDSDNTTHVNGIIGNNLIIRSLPRRIHDKILGKYPSQHPSVTKKPILLKENILHKPVYHVVIRTDTQVKSLYSKINERITEPDNILTNDLPPVTTTPLPVSDTLYPEVLIVIDYPTFVTHGSDIKAVSMYVAAFWNAVDLRFREMSEPNIRINIAGLIIPQQPEAAPYMTKHIVGKILIANLTLDSMKNYFASQKEFPEHTYDTVIALTSRDMGGHAENNTIHLGYTGMCYENGACKVKKGFAAGLVRDKGGFNGITTAAHELAHLLGAPHDGNDTVNITGGPCPWEDGYLMSYDRVSINGIHWSHCSKTAMREYVTSKDGKCLRNKPNVGKSYPKILPGNILSRDEQCKKIMHTISSKTDEHNCAILWCLRNINGTLYRVTQQRPPGEGSSCGINAVCLNGECIKYSEYD